MKPQKKNKLTLEVCFNIESNIKTFELFTYFTTKIYKTENLLNQSQNTLSSQQKFFSLINNTVPNTLPDKEYWWKYFLFQFIYWSQVELQQVKYPAYSFVIGEKAWDRWINRDENYDFTILTNKIKTKYNISKVDYTNTLLIKSRLFNPVPKVKKKQFSMESVIRKKYHNTPKGLDLCLTLTSLFDPLDISCITCKEKSTCRELLKANNLRLYNNRITV